MKIRNNFVKNGTLTIIILPGDTDERIACWTSSQLNVWRQTSILYWVKKFMFHSFVTRSVKICYGFWHFKPLFGNFLYGLQREQLQWPKSFQWISIHVTSGQDSFSRILNVDWSIQISDSPAKCKGCDRGNSESVQKDSFYSDCTKSKECLLSKEKFVQM